MNIKHIGMALLSMTLLSCLSDTQDEAKLSSELLNVEKEVELSAVETEKSVTVSADCHWEVSVDKQGWEELAIQPLSGSGNGVITIKTASNTSVSERTAFLTVTSAGGLRQRVTVRQTLGGATLTVNKTELAFEAVPTSSQSFTVTSNTTWSILGIDDGWLSVEPSGGGSGTTEVRVTAAEIQDEFSRSQTLTVALDNGTERHDVQVTQAGKTGITLALTPAELAAFEATGGQQTVAIACNVRWYADMPANDWLSISASEGVGNGNLTVSCQPNYATEARVVRINVTTGTREPRQASLAVNQKAATLPEITVPLAMADHTLTKSGASFTFGYASMFLVTDHGICYSTTNAMPTVGDTRLSLGGGGTADNAVAAALDGLEPNTTYHVRAYVQSPVGGGRIVYSDVVTFATLIGAPAEGDNPYPQLGRKR